MEALGGKSIKDIRAEFIQVRAEVNAPNTEGPMNRKRRSNRWCGRYTGYGDQPTSVTKEMLQYMDENNVNLWVAEHWSDLFCKAAMVVCCGATLETAFKYHSDVSPELDSLKSEYLCHSQQAGRPLLSKPLDYLKTLVYPCLRAGCAGGAGAHKTSLITLLIAAQAVATSASKSGALIEDEDKFMTVCGVLLILAFFFFIMMRCLSGLSGVRMLYQPKVEDLQMRFPDMKLSITDAEKNDLNGPCMCTLH